MHASMGDLERKYYMGASCGTDFVAKTNGTFERAECNY